MPANAVTTIDLVHPDGRPTRYRMMSPSRPGRWPVVIFSHGANSSSESYDRLWRAWAARGFAVIGPNHVDSGPRASQSTPPAAGLWASRLADVALPLRQRQRFDTAARASGGKLDWRRLAAAGHSFGAVVAQALAGARVDDAIAKAPLPAREPMVRACLAFSPPGPLKGFIPDDAWAGVSVPCLLQTGDADRLPGFVDDWHSRLKGYAPAADRWTAIGHGVDHYFGGLICRLTPGEHAQDTALYRIAELSANFLAAYVADQPAARDSLTARGRAADDGIVIVRPPNAPALASAVASGVAIAAGLAASNPTLSRRAVIGAGLSLAVAPPVAFAQAPFPASDAVPIAGALGGPRPLPPGGLIAADALAVAQHYADSLGGTALLITLGGSLVHERYTTNVDATTRLKTYSMAKSVMGLVYGVAIAERIVALDDPVGRHIVEWRGDPRGAITLRQLLQMRSGLKLESLAARTPKAIELVIGRHVTDAALSTTLVGAPGATFEYNNVNSFLAGLALDRALTGAGRGRYADFLSRRLWAPLGQADATLDVEAAPAGEPRFFAGLDATARDWARIGGLFVDSGRVAGRQVIPADWLRAMTTPSPNPVYGVQMWIGRPWTRVRRYGPNTATTVPCKEPYLARDLIFFDGAGGQRVYMVPSRKLVIVRTGVASNEWEDSTVPNAILRGLA